MTVRRISVVLPVYDEALNIATSLRGLWEALRDVEHEILVCYDSPGDTTLPAIAAMTDAPPTVRLVHNTIGRGAANAIRAGFAAATGDVVVTTMADLSDPPDRIPVLAEKLRAEGLAVVAGSRYVRGGSQTGGPLIKRTLSRWAGLILRALAGIGTHDVTSNFRAYSASFLASTPVESRAGFEIALELTTKAHNAGLGVGEVPSSWRDRSAGTSRFRMWKWMPSYLRWWMTAAIAPAFVWAVLIGLATVAWQLERAAGTRAPIGRAIVALGVIAAATAILGLRRARGRTVPTDAVQAALWVHPWHAQLVTGGSAAIDVAATSALALLHAWIALGTQRARAAIARARTRCAGTWQTTVGLVLLAGIFVAARFVEVDPAATTDIDESWQQLIGTALARGDQWGRDVVFTFGPLGYFLRGTYVPELYWTKVLWWEIGLKALIAFGLLAMSRRMSGPLEKSAYVLALFGATGGFDTLNFLALTAAGCWLIATPVVGVALTAGVLGVLALVAITKFTSFVLFCVVLAAVAIARGRQGTWGDAGRFLGLAALMFFAAWTLAAGQLPWNFPAWVRASLAIASGHNQAMSAEGLQIVADTADAKFLLVLAAGIAVASVLERARDATRWIASGLFAFATFVAFKAGFTRHGHNAITFFAFVAVAPWFLFPASAPGPLAPFVRPLLAGARIVVAFVALMGIARIFGNVQVVPSQPYVVLLNDLEHGPRRIAGAVEREELLQVLRANAARTWDLPRMRAAIGAEPIDHFFSDQGIVLINDFVLRGRPVIQSYVAYTPELAELDAAFYRSERAPRFVTYRHTSLDGRLPGLEDGPTQLILLRDYRLLLAENGTLLFERDPQPGTPQAQLLLERTVAFHETVDVAGLGADLVLAAIDVDLSTKGDLRRVLLRGPYVWVDLELDGGIVVRHRFEPGMGHTPFLLSPHVDSTTAAQRHRLGQEVPRVRAFRLLVSAEDAERFEPTIRVRLYDGADWKPRPVDLAAFTAASDDGASRREIVREFEVRHAALGDAPVHVRAMREPEATQIEGVDALLTPAPCELAFPLADGARRMTARFAVPEYSWRWTTAKGFLLLVAVRGADGVEQKLTTKTLNPDHYLGDRGFLDLGVDLPAGTGRTLLVRVRPGLSTTLGKDLVAWTSIAIE